MNANLDAITKVLELPGLMLVEYPQGRLLTVPDWASSRGPSMSRDRLVALLGVITEAEYEPWILDCFAQERDNWRRLPNLRAMRGRVYVR